MSPYVFYVGGFVKADVFIINSSPGQLWGAHVDLAEGVVRLSNFSLEKFFHNLVYSRKSLRETNIILVIMTKCYIIYN